MAAPATAGAARWLQVDTAAGTVPALLPPESWNDGEPRLDPVPAPGQHTDAILQEIGVTAAEMAELRAAARSEKNPQHSHFFVQRVDRPD